MTSSEPASSQSASSDENDEILADLVKQSSTPNTPRRKRRRRRWLEGKVGPTAAGVIEWIVVIALAVVLAVVVKAFFLQAFYIPSESMEPTLKIGDRVLVDKFSYRVSGIDRGDIVVFDRPEGEVSTEVSFLIKRVIGLGGDEIVIQGGSVYVNGTKLEESYLPEGVTTSGANTPNPCAPSAPCVIPKGEVWVMGDNRNVSRDSRYFGPIPESSIVGRAFVTLWPVSSFKIL